MTNKKPNTKNLKPWQPGQSGNPKGLKKGTKQLTTILQKLVDRKIKVRDPFVKSKKKIEMTVGEALNFNLLALGLKGNIKALTLIYDRIEGKAINQMEISGSLSVEIIKDKIRGYLDNNE